LESWPLGSGKWSANTLLISLHCQLVTLVLYLSTSCKKVEKTLSVDALAFCSHVVICRFSVMCQLTISPCIVEDPGLINMMLCCFSLSSIQGRG
jgi:hypothetical protein